MKQSIIENNQRAREMASEGQTDKLLPPIPKSRAVPICNDYYPENAADIPFGIVDFWGDFY